MACGKLDGVGLRDVKVVGAGSGGTHRAVGGPGAGGKGGGGVDGCKVTVCMAAAGDGGGLVGEDGELTLGGAVDGHLGAAVWGEGFRVVGGIGRKGGRLLGGRGFGVAVDGRWREIACQSRFRGRAGGG